MADQAQLEILKRGVRAWNDWVRRNPGRTKLSGANLIGANLNWADFSGADLNRAQLKGADLNMANLSGANLVNADLAETKLTSANLSRADLKGAHLRDANLSGAYLVNANLAETKLTSANLSGADLSEASLVMADLSGANLSEAYLNRANLSLAFLAKAKLSKAKFAGADLSEAYLAGADLSEAHLSTADLGGASLSEAYLGGADLSGANLSRADLGGASLRDANLSGANLSGANLQGATVVRTNLMNAILVNCRIYGISAWDLEGIPSEQSGLIITSDREPEVKVDDLEVAQFVYLLLNNDKIRNMIDTIGRKGVLILGRFTHERKAVLDAIREELRRLGYVPMMFDFEKSEERDFTETIMTLAGMSRFIIADITNPSSSPLELQATVPNYMIPFVPIIQKGERPFAMFKDLYGKFDWVLKPLEYDSAENLIEKLDKAVVKRALEKHAELMLKKAQNPEMVDQDDF